VATQRTGLPPSEIIGLGMVVLTNEANVRYYPDLDWTKLYSQCLGYTLTPIGHLTATNSSTTIRFGNSHNIPNFLRKHVKNITLDERLTTLGWEPMFFLISDRNSKQNSLIKTQNFKCLLFKLDSYKRGNKVYKMLSHVLHWAKTMYSCSIKAKIYWL